MAKKKNIIILGNFHSHPSSEAFLQKFVKIINEVGNNVYVISGDKPPLYDNVFWIKVEASTEGNILKRILLFIKNQLEIILYLYKYEKYYDFAFVLSTGFFMPVLFLKLIKRPVGLFIAQKTQSFLTLFARLNFILSDVLIVESNNVLNEWGINKYKNKVMNGALYVDINFNKFKDLDEREKVVGFIGTLSKTKCAINFVYSIPLIIEKQKDLKFIIGGNGELYEKIEKYINAQGISKCVELVGWISHDKLPVYLNDLKLIVLPSLSEGLPNIILESMSCNTPVLSTAVGGIPDVIKNKKTGFIMEENSPQYIAESVIKAIKSPELTKIAENANKIIEKEYRYSFAIERYKKILGSTHEN